MSFRLTEITDTKEYNWGDPRFLQIRRDPESAILLHQFFFFQQGLIKNVPPAKKPDAGEDDIWNNQH